MNRCKILSSKNAWFEIHIKIYNKDNMFLLILVGNVCVKINKIFIGILSFNMHFKPRIFKT